MNEYSITIPWPPSCNGVWRRVAGRTLLSENARVFRLAVRSAVVAARAKGDMPRSSLTIPLAVDMRFYPPTKARRDLDNLPKALLDALTHAGVWLDDSQVRDLRLRWGHVVTGGACRVTLRAFSDEPQGPTSLLNLQHEEKENV